MKIKCIKNKAGNSCFTLGNEYEIRKNADGYFGSYIIQDNFCSAFIDKADLPKNILSMNIGDSFKFAVCEFERIS